MCVCVYTHIYRERHKRQRFIIRNWLAQHNYGSREVPWFAVGKLETQEYPWGRSQSESESEGRRRWGRGNVPLLHIFVLLMLPKDGWRSTHTGEEGDLLSSIYQLKC